MKLMVQIFMISLLVASSVIVACGEWGSKERSRGQYRRNGNINARR